MEDTYILVYARNLSEGNCNCSMSNISKKTNHLDFWRSKICISIYLFNSDFILKVAVRFPFRNNFGFYCLFSNTIDCSSIVVFVSTADYRTWDVLELLAFWLILYRINEFIFGNIQLNNSFGQISGDTFQRHSVGSDDSESVSFKLPNSKYGIFVVI